MLLAWSPLPVCCGHLQEEVSLWEEISSQTVVSSLPVPQDLHVVVSEVHFRALTVTLARSYIMLANRGL